MKVILTEEVVGLGEPGKLVDVAPGYARNYLVPRNFAVYADKASVRELEHHKQRLERKRKRLADAALSKAERLNGQTITIKARVGKEGKLYGSVTAADIADTILAELGVEVDRRRIQVERIHLLGSYQADIHLMGETHAVVTVNIEDVSGKQTAVAEPAVEAAPAPAEAPAVEAAPEATEEA